MTTTMMSETTKKIETTNTSYITWDPTELALRLFEHTYKCTVVYASGRVEENAILHWTFTNGGSIGIQHQEGGMTYYSTGDYGEKFKLQTAEVYKKVK